MPTKNDGKSEDPITAEDPEKRSWVTDALKRKISEAMGIFAGMERNRPLELDFHDVVHAAINDALGTERRTVEQMEAEIEQLKKELERTKETKAQNERKTTFRDHREDEKKDDDGVA